MKLQYTFIRQFFLRGLRPQTPQRGYPPSALPRVEECTYFWGVNTSWGINTAESKRPINQEDNQAPQPTTNSASASPFKIAFISLALNLNSNLSSFEASTTGFIYPVSTTSHTSSPKAIRYVLILTFQKEIFFPSNRGGLVTEVPSCLFMFKV
jgi:hypothetical protein